MLSRRSRTLQSPKYIQKKRKKSIAKVFLGVICVVICLCVVVLVLRLPFLQITTVKLEKPGTLPAAELEHKALSVTEGNYFYLIPRSNSFFYPKKEISVAIMNAYRKIDSIRIVRKSFSTLEITMTERVPESVVCEGFREEDQTDVCFFADENGYVYAESPGFSDGVYLRYYVNSNPEKIAVGTHFIDPIKFVELQDFVRGVRANGISTLGILIGEGGSYELYIKNNDLTTAVVYFDDRNSFDTIMSNLLAFWNNKKANYNYINLRFGNNVFYSLK